MKKIEGMRWSELTAEEREDLLKDANNAIDARNSERVQEGDCIVDLTYPYSVPGEIKDGKIIIDDNAVIYNSEG